MSGPISFIFMLILLNNRLPCPSAKSWIRHLIIRRPQKRVYTYAQRGRPFSMSSVIYSYFFRTLATGGNKIEDKNITKLTLGLWWPVKLMLAKPNCRKSQVLLFPLNVW